jgi:hypothetical protein
MDWCQETRERALWRVSLAARVWRLCNTTLLELARVDFRAPVWSKISQVRARYVRPYESQSAVTATRSEGRPLREFGDSSEELSNVPIIQDSRLRWEDEQVTGDSEESQCLRRGPGEPWQ